MPQSKGKHNHDPHKNHPAVTHKQNAQRFNRLILLAIIFFTIFGLGISFFITDATVLSLTAGAVIGAILGYFFGHELQKSFSKKK